MLVEFQVLHQTNGLICSILYLRAVKCKVKSLVLLQNLGFKTFEIKVTWMQALHSHAENRNGFYSFYHCAVTMVLSLVFLSRCSDDQWHQCRHERWDRPSQELPESGGHHWEIQGGHLLLWQGNFTHTNVKVSSALSEIMNTTSPIALWVHLSDLH